MKEPDAAELSLDVIFAQRPENLDLYFTRVAGSLTGPELALFFVPVNTLSGPAGILERLRQQAAEIAVLA
jgi:hypothetical protein